MKPIPVILSLLLCTANVHAEDDAVKCISIGTGERSQTMTNNCGEKIEVIWCHTRDEKGYRSGLCGADGKYYRKQTVIKPAEVKENKFTLPFNSTIHYAACFGGYYTAKQSDTGGEYRCK